MPTTKTAKTKLIEKVSNSISKANSPRNELVEALQRQSSNAFVLYANYKHYHWQTFGPLFRDLHLMFDEFAAEVLETVDVLAERVRMIGQNPVSDLASILSTASIKSAQSNRNMREMIEEGNANLILVIKEMRQGAKLAEEYDDPGTVDIFSRFVQIHEKHEWWLRDILEKSDGLT